MFWIQMTNSQFYRTNESQLEPGSAPLQAPHSRAPHCSTHVQKSLKHKGSSRAAQGPTPRQPPSRKKPIWSSAFLATYFLLRPRIAPLPSLDKNPSLDSRLLSPLPLLTTYNARLPTPGTGSQRFLLPRAGRKASMFSSLASLPLPLCCCFVRALPEQLYGNLGHRLRRWGDRRRRPQDKV